MWSYFRVTQDTNMTTMHFRLACALLIVFAGFTPPPAYGQAEFFPPKKTPSLKEVPNIVLITGDHLRWDHVAANGNPAIITPHMDRLVKEGTTFRKCFTVGVACSPNRASLMTGRYPSSYGIISNGVQMPLDEVTLTHVLRDAGYYTGQMGKLHFWPHKDRNHREPYPPYGFHQMRLSDEPGCYDDAFGRWLWTQGKDVREKARVAMPGERKAFDYYTFEGEDRTTHASWVATETITFIEDTLRRQPDRPFFVHAGFYAPHPPLNPPASALALYKNRKLPPRRYHADEVSFLPPVLAKSMKNLLKTPEDVWTDYRKHFYAMVTHLDHNVGRIIEALEEGGVLDRTIFVLTSDHGDYLGDHNLRGKSDRPYDGAMRIPLIFRGPGVPKGVQVDELVEILDVMPTLLEQTQLPIPKGNQGISLTKTMRGGPGRGLIYMQGRDNKIIRAKNAKYSIYKNGQEVLFDLEKDPGEYRNIAQLPEGDELLGQMRVKLLQKTIEARDPLPERIRPY